MLTKVFVRLLIFLSAVFGLYTAARDGLTPREGVIAMFMFGIGIPILVYVGLCAIRDLSRWIRNRRVQLAPGVQELRHQELSTGRPRELTGQLAKDV